MIGQKMQEALNKQINAELYSAYIYLSMAAYLQSVNLPGAAHWMHIQFGEEQEHALKIFEFLNDRGGRVKLQAIDQPQTEWKSMLDVFQAALEHERKVSGMIHDLYALAVTEKDYPAQVMLQWFIDEQVEEEKNASDIVEKLKRIGDNSGLLLMLDNQLGAREEG